jgi:serine/threonine-protein kinase
MRAADVVIAVPAGGSLIALDAQSGDLRWQYDPHEGVWDRAYATDGRRIYVGIGGGGLVALDAESGEVLWTEDLGIEVQLPALVEGGLLYVSTTFVGPDLQNNHDGRAKLFTLNAVDGTERWSLETENYILQTPALHGETLYLAGNYLAREPVEQGGHMRLYALQASDGSIRWSYESEDGFPKRLYANDSTVSFIGYQDFVSGVDADDGQLRWRRDTGNWVPSLMGEADNIYFGSANTIVHALKLGTGDVLWQHNIEEGTFNYVLGAPILVEGELYFLSQHGDIMALDAQSGDLLWKLPTGITSRVGMHLFDGWIFLGDEDGVIYAYSDE